MGRAPGGRGATKTSGSRGETCAGKSQPGVDRLARNPEAGGHFVDLDPTEVMHHQHDPQPRIQSRQDGARDVASLPRQQGIVGPRSRVDPLSDAFTCGSSRQQLAGAPMQATPIGGDAKQDAKQPGPDRSFRIEVAQAPVHDHKHVLGDVRQIGLANSQASKL